MKRVASTAFALLGRTFVTPRFALRGLLVAGLGLAAQSAQAGSRVWDFTDAEDLAGLELFTSTANPVRTEGGVDNSGYLAITDAVNDRFGCIVFPDIDDGKPIAAFTLEADVRIGNATGNGGRPADGMAVSYARAGDPLLVAAVANSGNRTFDIRGSFSVPGGPEMGASTGVVVSFDTWSGNAYKDGSSDVEGLMIQVDGRVVHKYSMPTRNGACDDITSLETGPYDANNAGNPDGLCWTKLRVNMALDGKLTVSYKNQDILKDFQTTFFPSAGQIVFSGRTGGANANQHIDNVSLTTIPAERALTGVILDNPVRYRVLITDNVATGSILDPLTASFTLDGVAAVPSSSEKVGTVTTYIFDVPVTSPLAAGSSHTVGIVAKDTNGAALDGNRLFTVGAYSLIPSSLASGIDPATAERGWKAAVHKKAGGRTPGDANRTVNAERQIADGYLDVDGNPVENQVDPSQVVEGKISHEGGNVFLVDGVINIDQNKQGQGNFRAPGYPEDQFPGVATGDPNDFTVAFVGYVELAAGGYTFGVNSDDGFRHSFGRGLWDVFGQTVGEFDGGRGALDSVYNIVVTEPGLYPIRVLWWEGGGGANIEIFSVDGNGVRHLLNDDTDPASLKVYRSGAAKSHIASVMPVNRQFGGSQAEAPLIVKVVDGAAAVGAITLTLDGVVQTPTVEKVDNVTTLRIDYPNGQVPGTHVVKVEFDGHSQTYDFNIAQLQKSQGTANFVIEAEDFNDNGDVDPSVNTMPYVGGAMNGRSAVKHFDFFNNDGDDANNYRTEAGDGANDVNMDGGGSGGGSRNRGSWEMTTNYKIGWIGDDYFSYKRTVPAGTYIVVSAQSFDSPNANDIRGSLFVGSTPAMDDAVKLGTFNNHGTRGWGIDNLVQMKDNDGNVVVVTLDGSEKNFRFHAGSGDFNYFAFVPTSDPVFGPVASVPTGVSARGVLNIAITDRVGKVDRSTIALTLGGNNAAVVATATASGAAVAHTPASAYGAVGASIPYVLNYKDTAGASYSKSGNITVVGNSFYIEAEDYNYGGGNSVAAASTMPYYGGAYDGLGSIQGIDLRNSDGFDSNVYRFGEVQADGTTAANVNITGQGDNGRDGWNIVSNYRIGWIGGGDWMNYTRTFPAGNYEVQAALSFDGRDANQLSGELLKVTGDITAPGQSTETLGYFRAPGSGGWGLNNLVSMKSGTSADSAPAVITLSGPTTLRYVSNSGDFDYIKLTPSNRGTIGISNNGDGTVTVTWTAAGSLYSAEKVEGPYAPVAGGNASGVKLPLNSGGTLFLRVQE